MSDILRGILGGVSNVLDFAYDVSPRGQQARALQRRLDEQRRFENEQNLRQAQAVRNLINVSGQAGQQRNRLETNPQAFEQAFNVLDTTPRSLGFDPEGKEQFGGVPRIQADYLNEPNQFVPADRLKRMQRGATDQQMQPLDTLPTMPQPDVVQPDGVQQQPDLSNIDSDRRYMRAAFTGENAEEITPLFDSGTIVASDQAMPRIPVPQTQEGVPQIGAADQVPTIQTGQDISLSSMPEMETLPAIPRLNMGDIRNVVDEFNIGQRYLDLLDPITVTQSDALSQLTDQDLANLPPNVLKDVYEGITQPKFNIIDMGGIKYRYDPKTGKTTPIQSAAERLQAENTEIRRIVDETGVSPEIASIMYRNDFSQAKATKEKRQLEYMQNPEGAIARVEQDEDNALADQKVMSVEEAYGGLFFGDEFQAMAGSAISSMFGKNPASETLAAKKALQALHTAIEQTVTEISDNRQTAQVLEQVRKSLPKLNSATADSLALTQYKATLNDLVKPIVDNKRRIAMMYLRSGDTTNGIKELNDYGTIYSVQKRLQSVINSLENSENAANVDKTQPEAASARPEDIIYYLREDDAVR